MNASQTILSRTLVRPFYKQNSGLFIFIIVIMFGVDGSDMLDYHYALILGMLNNPIIFVLIVLLWVIYALKCASFVTASMQKNENFFLNILAGLERRKRINQLFFTQLQLYLPVFLYALIITIVAFYNERFAAGTAIFVVNVVICISSAYLYNYILCNQGKTFTTFFDGLFQVHIGKKSYTGIMLRYILDQQKAILFSLKCYTCGVLYLIFHHLSKDEYDIRLPYILYSFGLFGHGILIWLIRDFQEKKMIVLRTLPRSKAYHYAQYAKLYLILLLPEYATIILLALRYLNPKDAGMIMACSISVLLLLNSLTLVTGQSKREFLKISLAIFLLLVFSVFTKTEIWTAPLFVTSSALIFATGYFKYESAKNQ